MGGIFVKDSIAWGGPALGDRQKRIPESRMISCLEIPGGIHGHIYGMERPDGHHAMSSIDKFSRYIPGAVPSKWS